MKNGWWLILVLIISSCSEESMDDCLTPIYTSKILENKKIILAENEFGTLTREYLEGDKLVFEHSEIIDCENIIDEESFSYISFEVDKSSQKFNYTDSISLSSVKANFYQDGAWFRFVFPIKEGLISGERIGNKWVVSLEFNVYYPFTGNPSDPKLFTALDTTVIF